MYSFQLRVNAKINADRIPGSASGTTMRSIACTRLAPSINALSSSSRGMDWKYPVNNQVQNGTRNVGYVRINAHIVFDKFVAPPSSISFSAAPLAVNPHNPSDTPMPSSNMPGNHPANGPHPTRFSGGTSSMNSGSPTATVENATVI